MPAMRTCIRVKLGLSKRRLLCDIHSNINIIAYLIK